MCEEKMELDKKGIEEEERRGGASKGTVRGRGSGGRRWEVSCSRLLKTEKKKAHNALSTPKNTQKIRRINRCHENLYTHVIFIIQGFIIYLVLRRFNYEEKE